MDSLKVNTAVLREQAQSLAGQPDTGYLALFLSQLLDRLDAEGSVSVINDTWTKQMFIEQAMRQLEADLNRPEVKQALEKCIQETLDEAEQKQPTYVLVSHESGGAAHLCEQTTDGKVLHALCGATKRTGAGWYLSPAKLTVCKRCGQIAQSTRRA